MNVTATPPSVYGSVRAELKALCHGLRCESQTPGSAHTTASTTGTVSQQHQQPRARRASSQSRWPAGSLSVSARRAMSECSAVSESGFSGIPAMQGRHTLSCRSAKRAPRNECGALQNLHTVGSNPPPRAITLRRKVANCPREKAEKSCVSFNP